jgi:hypothetical protein
MATAPFVQLVIDSKASLGRWVVAAFLRAELPHNAAVPHPARVS